MAQIKIGTRLKAINSCKMFGLKQYALTIGKSYKVINKTKDEITIVDDQKYNHYFYINGIWDYFEVKVSKNPQY